VLDNKQPRKILFFRTADEPAAESDPPVEIILLLDAVNTPLPGLAYARQQLEKLFRQNSGHLPQPISMAFVTSAGMTVQNEPSRDGDFLRASLSRNGPELRSSTKLRGQNDINRLESSLDSLESLAIDKTAKPGRKMLIWISPGWPVISGPSMDVPQRVQQQLFNHIVALSTELRKARITLYNFDPMGSWYDGGFQTVYYQEFLKGVPKPSRAFPGNLALQVLVHQSGGTDMSSNNNLAGEIAKCIAGANSLYTLVFESASAEHPNEYHAVEVKIGEEGLRARTRTAYYAQPEQVR
jgi:VWFA-related protein